MEYFDPQPGPKFGGSLWPCGPELPRTSWQGGSEVENEGVRHRLLETTQLQVGKLFVSLSFFKNSVFFCRLSTFVRFFFTADLDVFFQGFDPLPTQRVPLCTILRYPILISIFQGFCSALGEIGKSIWSTKKNPPPEKVLDSPLIKTQSHRRFLSCRLTFCNSANQGRI